ncbi:MAG TPA: hypothetical protein VFM58_06085 [Solirubrobacteraceae bacterium]|nr:hypothetical protein [Solirubrobacteraceae bacterium]
MVVVVVLLVLLVVVAFALWRRRGREPYHVEGAPREAGSRVPYPHHGEIGGRGSGGVGI